MEVSREVCCLKGRMRREKGILCIADGSVRDL